MKNQITQGEWVTQSDDYDITIVDKFDSIENAVFGGYPEICTVNNDELAQAICKAVNNTYSKGIDPEKIKLLIDTTKLILDSADTIKRHLIKNMLFTALDKLKLEDK